MTKIISSYPLENKTLNPCTRCGSERILEKTWKENQVTITGKVQTVVFGRTICPNAQCQKIVDEAIEVEETRAKLKKQKNAPLSAKR